MKKIILTYILALSIGAIFGQNKVETIEFFANGICGECTTNIEYSLDAKGVKFASFDLETQTVKVIYKTKKIDEETIHQLVNSAGYDTDKSKADYEAREALPRCCKEVGACEDSKVKEDPKDGDLDHEEKEDNK